MRPKSLWQVLTETWWSSLKRAKHVLRLEIRAGARADLHLNGIQVNAQEHSSMRKGESTFLGVHSEAKSMNVAEDDIPVTAHWLPVGQNESIGALPLNGTVRFGTARYVTVRYGSVRVGLRVHCSLVPL